MLDFLKTIPDMTNTPEITMQEETPKISMSARIRNYKAANPDANAKQIADAVGTSTVYVYQILSNPPKNNSKVKTAKKVAPVAEKPVKNKELEDAKEEIEALNMVIAVQKRQTEKHLAVIEYLEGRIGELSELVYG
jgi:hypothetical protein